MFNLNRIFRKTKHISCLLASRTEIFFRGNLRCFSILNNSTSILLVYNIRSSRFETYIAISFIVSFDFIFTINTTNFICNTHAFLFNFGLGLGIFSYISKFYRVLYIPNYFYFLTFAVCSNLVVILHFHVIFNSSSTSTFVSSSASTISAFPLPLLSISSFEN